MIACHGVAAADFGEQIDARLDAMHVLPPPEAVPVWLAPADRARRAATFLAAIPRTSHPLAKANLWLALGDLELAAAIENKRTATALLDAGDYAGAIELEATIGNSLYTANGHYTTATLAKRWRGLPRALAHHAYVLDLARFPEALVVHRRIITEFPTSPFAARSHVMLGDALLANRKVDEATAQYRAVVTDDPQLRAYVLFRIGMIELDGRLWVPAYDKLAAALALGPPPAVADELRRAVTRAYARFGEPVPAYETFRQLAPADAKAMLIDLAAQYGLVVNRAGAAAVFAQLVRRYPRDLAACTWQTRVTEAAFLGSDPAAMFREAARLVQVYHRLHHVLPPDDDLSCESAARELTVGAANRSLDKSLSRQLAELWYAFAP